MRLEDKEYASKGVSGAGLGLGIAGTALGLLNGNGILGNLFGGNHNHEGCDSMTAILPVLMSMAGNRGGFSSEPYVTRHELDMQNQITNRDAEIVFLRGRDAAKSDSLELYRYIDGRFRNVEAQIAQQAVVNAQISANLACQQTAIATLQGLTKTVIPITSVCPAPMPEYNSWTAPTTTTAG